MFSWLFQSTHVCVNIESIPLPQEEKPDLTQTKTESEPLKTEEKDSGNDDNEEEDAPHKGNADEGSLTACIGAENMKPDQDEEQESKDNSGQVV